MFVTEEEHNGAGIIQFVPKSETISRLVKMVKQDRQPYILLKSGTSVMSTR